MNASQNLTRAQLSFLRAFHVTPAGPKPQDWPSPAILRRWLRKPTFRSAYQSLVALTRNQLSFQLLCASLQSVQDLQSDLRHRDTDSGRLSKSQRAICLDLLKLTRTHLPRAKAAEPGIEDETLGLAQTPPADHVLEWTPPAALLFQPEPQAPSDMGSDRGIAGRKPSLHRTLHRP